MKIKLWAIAERRYVEGCMPIVLEMVEAPRGAAKYVWSISRTLCYSE